MQGQVTRWSPLTTCQCRGTLAQGTALPRSTTPIPGRVEAVPTLLRASAGLCRHPVAVLGSGVVGPLLPGH